MKELLAKIMQTVERDHAQAKCALVTQAYEQMSIKLEKVSSDLAAVGLEVDPAAFHSKLDELESICDGLVKILNPELQKVLNFLKPRFEQNMHRHKGIRWEQVEKRLLEADPKKLWSLSEMERTGGEPDVVGLDKMTSELIFQDRSAESPTGRRNCVYDKDGEEKLRREYPDRTCNSNAVDMATQMGVELLDEKEYREAQEIDELDNNNWSWLKTPINRRKEGFAHFGIRDEFILEIRDSDPAYYGADGGWRGSLRV